MQCEIRSRRASSLGGHQLLHSRSLVLRATTSRPGRVNTFRGKQALIMLQILLVVLICLLAYVYGPRWAPQPDGAGVESRLEFLAVWLLIPAFAVFACTLVTMLHRLFSPQAIDGTRRPESRFLEINLRVTQNTVEQSFLAAAAWVGLAFALPAERLALIPVLAILFLTGRILFWLGYQVAPAWRATGFGLSALPTAVALLWLAWHAVSG